MSTVERAQYGERELADLRDSVALVTSELVTNGLVHGAEDEDVWVSVHGCEDSVLVVVDSGLKDQEPGLRNNYLTDESGRGLTMVVAIAKEWGYGRRGGFMRVWAKLAVSGEVSS
ncbi:ATP-binding protein [Streptomyces sp. NPDC048442]|uniref:ATP-binding protein n=1 Tax=Streptomyces sp. NPDC048442 TaxID=3154823 RepID=UPI00341638E3